MDLNEPLNSQWNCNYKIPKEIKDQMPGYFYFALAGELTSVFGPIIWDEEPNEDGTSSRSLGSVFNTSGYYLAFKMTCMKLGKFDLLSYYESLSWQDSDMFDAEVKEELDNLIGVIDCDHDLGDYAKDGGDGIKLLDWLEKKHRHYTIRLHTMNPVGRQNMEAVIKKNRWTYVPW